MCCLDNRHIRLFSIPGERQTSTVQVKKDPRVIRSRTQIIDAFVLLSGKKPFSSITVKDITTEARINRATFYNHFLDKYDLLEQVVSEALRSNLGCSSRPDIKEHLSTEDTLRELFSSLIRFEKTLDSYSDGSEESEMIDLVIHSHLIDILSSHLALHKPGIESSVHLKLARMLTHALLGMTKDYCESIQAEAPEDYIDPVLPALINGLDTL